MKRIAILGLLAAMSLPAWCGGDEGYAQATFPEKTHDFGTIKENGGPVSTTFEFVNTGNKPLLILDAAASCGCTRPEFTTKPVKPGKKGKVKVTYSPLGRPGGFRKTVRVKTNGRERSTVLVIEGTAMPAAR